MEYSDEQHVHFEEHGYVRLGKVLDDAGLAALQQRIDAIMLGEIPYPEMEFQLDGEDADYAKMPTVSAGHKGHHAPVSQDHGFGAGPRLSRLHAASTLPPDHPALYRRGCVDFSGDVYEQAGEKGTILPWHQDVGVGWGVGYNPTTTVWTAIDPATVANGCMQVVPGSHKHGVITEGHFPSEEQLAEYAPPGAEIDLEAEAGEAILLNNLLLHRSGINPTGQSRRAFSIAYMDGASRSVRTGEGYPMIFGAEALVPA